MINAYLIFHAIRYNHDTNATGICLFCFARCAVTNCVGLDVHCKKQVVLGFKQIPHVKEQLVSQIKSGLIQMFNTDGEGKSCIHCIKL